MRGLPSDTDHLPHLRNTILRTFYLFQLCVSAPLCIFLGLWAFVRLVEVHRAIYDFAASLFTSLMAGLITFILIVQRRTFEQGVPIELTMQFEEAKSALATSLWIWELVDSGVQPIGMWNRRGPRMAAAGMSAVVVLTIFYPTVFYVARERRRLRDTATIRCAEQEEPLEYNTLVEV